MITPKQAGFTIIEMLVAVTILLIGVLGPLALAVNGITDGLYARNQITANFLAVEGMEKVINKRDSNAFTYDNTGVGTAFDNLAPVTVEKLAYNSAAGVYNDTGTDGPEFTRTTNVVINGTEAKVTVTIDWHNKLAPKSLELVNYLYAQN